ncbi:MAG: heavy metal-associated domain-containing protein [Bryobacteraceae bacterium]
MAHSTVKFSVIGMTCANCARSVERKLAATPGVGKASVDLGSASAEVEYDPARATPETLAGAIRQLGYEVGA